MSTEEAVREITEHIMNQIQGEEVTYRSLDTMCKATTNNIRMEKMYPTEFLNTLKFPINKN
jgi:ATP-dependent DNA helicase PIF1